MSYSKIKIFIDLSDLLAPECCAVPISGVLGLIGQGDVLGGEDRALLVEDVVQDVDVGLAPVEVAHGSSSSRPRAPAPGRQENSSPQTFTL